MAALTHSRHAAARDRSGPRATSPARCSRTAYSGALLGNKAHLRRLSSAPVALQAKLAIGAVNDPLEREADAVADQVMRMADPALSHTATAPSVSAEPAETPEFAIKVCDSNFGPGTVEVFDHCKRVVFKPKDGSPQREFVLQTLTQHGVDPLPVYVRTGSQVWLPPKDLEGLVWVQLSKEHCGEKLTNPQQNDEEPIP
jgi:hypothetical protein